MRDLLSIALSLAAAATTLGACSSDTSVPVEAACNPLGDGHCMTPWPSSAFEVDDAASATGRRLAIPEGTLPTNADGVTGDPAGWNLADGFSPAAPIVMAWKGGVSPDGLAAADHVERSLAADSSTVVLDMTTGTRVAHVAELDAQAGDAPDAQALLLRPAARLIGGHRYAVGITRRVHARDGGELTVPPGFAALRDHHNTDHALLEAMRPRFADVLDALDAAGFPADDLVVAWDFTVASDDFLRRDMLAARDRTAAALAGHPVAISIARDAPIGDGSVIRRKLVGTLDAPLFLTQGGAAIAGTRIARDADGLPAMQGFYQIPFTAIVPACAYAPAAAPVPIVIHGHDLLGSAAETAGRAQQATAAARCVVLVGTDLRGLSSLDLAAVAHVLSDVGRADEVMEVVEQGLVNQLALAEALRTTFATQVLTDGARRLVDPARITYAPATVGYEAQLERSADWATYRSILANSYPNPLDVTLALGLFQMRWDKVEATGLAGTARTL